MTLDKVACMVLPWFTGIVFLSLRVTLSWFCDGIWSYCNVWQKLFGDVLIYFDAVHEFE